MNEHRSHFRDELAIIPPVATWIAFAVFALIEIGLLWILPRHGCDLPPRPWWPIIAVVGGAFVAIIILMIGYVNADSKRRGMNSLLWTLLVIFIPKALGFIAYFLLRKPLLVPCPKCGTPAIPDFRFCHKCGYALSPTCAHCGRAISHDFACCPYCGKPVAAPA
jgi:hypothetical protein